MPGGDRSGPMGQGPATGRRAGYCAGFDVPGYANAMPAGGRGMAWGRGGGMGRGRGRGMAWGRGGGMGWGRGRGMAWGAGAGWGAPWAPAPGWPPSRWSAGDELDALRVEAEQLGAALEEVQKRMTEIEARSDSDD